MSAQTAERLTAALGEVFGALNVLGSNNSSVVRDFFLRQHRTLQQQFVKVVVIPVLQELASRFDSGAYDSRNQASVELAHKLLAAVTEDDLYLPLI